MATSIGELGAIELGSSIGLVSCLSFEERSLHVGTLLAARGLANWICFANDDIEANINEIKNRASSVASSCGARFSIHSTLKRNPIFTADAMIEVLRQVVSEKRLHWVIDISTMTHEMVCILVAALEELQDRWPRLTIIYNIASRYSDNESDDKRKWVSRGIHGVRSVVGFSGLPLPGEQTTLVALPGFDLERVTRIVDELEPEKLIVGIGQPLFAEHKWLFDKNVAMARHLTAHRTGGIFNYTSLDIEEAAAAVLAQRHTLRGNVVLCPLNSKISTFGLALLARKIQDWQICYAPALIYNINYSTPSSRFASFRYDTVKRSISKLVSGSLMDTTFDRLEYA